MKMSASRVWLGSMGVTVALLVLVGVIGVALAQEPAPEDQADISGAATVTSKINYQGELREGGAPVTGSRVMTVRMYSDVSCSTLLTTVALGSVPVTNGRFSVAVAVPNGTFRGDGVWLRLDVAGTLMSCQEVLPVPYALGLRPQAYVRGAMSGTALGNAIVNVENTAASYLGTTNGIYVHAATSSALRASSGGMGVYATSDWTYAVRGSSINGTGGYFTSEGGHGLWATTTSNVHYHHGGSFSANGGYGIYATSSTNNAIRAVGGSSLSGVWQPGGVVGVAGLSQTRVGVYGSSRDDAGVYGRSQYDYGVWGEGGTVGVFASVSTGIAFRGQGQSTLIELWDTKPNPDNLRFRVSDTGNVYADGSYTSPASDFAELWPAGAGLEPGDVLSIDPNGQLVLSTQPYQPEVVGVYSTQPGFVGNRAEDGKDAGKVPLAMVGVVPVKVSAENGAIRPGNLLVASATPGHAMRAGDDPPSGTVIGKALASLDDGLGVVDMLVMLR